MPDAAEAAPRAILEAGGRGRHWAEVLAGAYFLGDAAALHAEQADALAALRYAEEEGFSADGEGESAGEDFRLEHNLITGEEMERWLDHCGIGIEEFDAHFAGRSLAARFEGRLGEIRRDYGPAVDEVVASMWSAVILSGSFEVCTEPFVRRLAARLDAAALPDAPAVAAALAAGGPRVPEPLRAPGLLEELAAMEACAAAAEQRAASPEHCARELRERTYQLTRVVVAEAVFPSADQANEAYQAIVADGLGLEQVARRAGVELQERMLFADEAPEGALPLLSATPGRATEPEAVETGFVVRLLRRRIQPDLADPDVEERVQRRLLEAHFAALVSAHVTRSFDPWTLT